MNFFLEKQRWKVLLGPLRKAKKFAILKALVSLFWSIESILGVALFANVVGAIEQNNQHQFYLYVGGLIGLLILGQSIQFFGRNRSSKFMIGLKSEIEKIVLSKFFVMDNNEVELEGTGKILQLTDSGIQSWADVLHLTIGRFLHRGLSGIFALMYVAKISFWFFAISVIFVVVTIVVVLQIDKKAKFFREQKRDLYNEQSRVKTKCIMSKYEVLQTGKIEKEIKGIQGILNKILHISFKENFYNYFTYSLPDILAEFVKIAMYIIFGSLVFLGTGSLADLTAVLGSWSYVTNMIRQFSNAREMYATAFVNLEKLFSFMENTKPVENYIQGEDFCFEKGSIVINNLNFSYKDVPVFSEFSLDIPAGKKIALVGMSGSGKSTLIKLIAGYLHAQEGEIFVDGQALSQINLKSFYQHVGYLTQDPSVFDGTIEENLLYALKKRVSKKDINDVLRLAKCDFVFDLKDGIKTAIGERGVRLSGGQKQRLAIAKIMLKNPGIVLLDEPTSALDSISEKDVSAAFHNLFEGRTVIVVAHRLQTVRACDEILVLADGKIVERGTHEQLQVQGGAYQEMLELQSRF